MVDSETELRYQCKEVYLGGKTFITRSAKINMAEG